MIKEEYDHDRKRIKRESEIKSEFKNDEETEIKNEIKSEFKEPLPVKKKEVISLEELKEKLKNDEKVKSKPVFLTKEQRAGKMSNDYCCSSF